ncbi:hypothetical protein AAG570_005372 [Ranatra chinensis]|uniref:Dynein heavy chain AAA module D4 domain-containing protein n=1 Tax=Ranatra chinensis TaxID=642074 RepID=A0ABD0Y0J9_9HEMI
MASKRRNMFYENKKLETTEIGHMVFSIMLSRGYNEASFKEDMKALYDQLGVKRRSTVFLFTASQVVEEGFLEMVNNMLTIGMIPALFSDEDKDSITNQVRNFSKRDGYGITKFIQMHLAFVNTKGGSSSSNPKGTKVTDPQRATYCFNVTILKRCLIA